MKEIKIFDTTLRDGEQSPGASLNKQEKLLIAKQLAKTGVDIIEAGFPIASEDDFEAVKLIATEVKGPIICGLARTVKKDLDRAWEAVKHSDKPRIHTFVATSKVHMDKKLKKSKEEILAMVTDMVSYASSICPDIEFSPEDAARTDMDFMIEVIRTAINAGARTINVPDTVGYSVPEEFGKRIEYIFEKLQGLIDENNVTISVHCHNDLGNAVANSLAAVKAGATQVETCVNGIGERAGNAALEEVVMNLKTRKNFFNADTKIVTTELYKTSRLVSKLTGLDVARSKAVVGKNAFAHESGIHQHGIINDASTYEIMTPQSVGWIGENLVLGKHSGKAAVEKVLIEEGYDLEADKIIEVTNKVKELADKQKEITHRDIIAIANDVTGKLTEEERIIKLQDVNINISKEGAKSSVTLNINGEEKTALGDGVGPVDATANAIKKLVDSRLRLKEYKLNAITGGTDALAHVSIIVEDGDKSYAAKGTDQDIVMASAYAIIQGMNKAMAGRK
ncbi:2-isopropylmalate synthase [archaeon D22]|nr:2-isopropylmalate synthase [archaeon D22]